MVHILTPSELAQLVGSHGVDRAPVELIDVRGREEWEGGHIPGARLLPLGELRTDPEAMLPRDTILVFVCAKGVRSMEAAKLADRFGFARVFNLEGGTKRWASEGFEIISESRAAA